MKISLLNLLGLIALIAVPVIGFSSKDKVFEKQSATPALIEQFGIFEATFESNAYYPNPYVNASMTARFTYSDGKTYQIPGFWDGGQTWKVRLSPEQSGRWAFETVSQDQGLNGHRGTFDVTASSKRGGIKQSSGTHFQYQDGSPMWFLGDTQWTGFATNPTEDLTWRTLQTYLDKRKAQGFNVIHTMLMPDPETGMSRNEGGAPFTHYAAQTLNPAYWQIIDQRLQGYQDRGLTAALVLAWGNGDAGWAAFPDDSARLRYARYITARYSAYNIYFVVAGEWQKGRLLKDTFVDLGQAIADSDPHERLIAIHPSAVVTPEPATTESFNTSARWMGFGDYQQNYQHLHARILSARQRQGKPTVNAEYGYFLRDKDGDSRCDKANSCTRTEFRHAAYDILMAGGYLISGFGTTYYGGYRDPGTFNVAALQNDPAEADLVNMHTLFTDLKWWALEPKDALVSGTGTQYALFERGAQYLAYVRGGSGALSLSLDGAVHTTYSVTRFDPRQGTYHPLADYTGTGPVPLPVPDEEDWLFVLKKK